MTSFRDWAAFAAVALWILFFVLPGSHRMLAGLFGAMQ